MQDRQDQEERLHERIWELLPWHVNGTLSGPEREQVEAHVAECDRCAREVEAGRQMAAAMKSLGEVSPSPYPVQLRRTLARIDEAERTPPSRRLEAEPEDAAVPRLGMLRALIAATPRPAARGAGGPGGRHPPAGRGARLGRAALASPAPVTYQTLSDAAAAPARTVAVRVMFSQRATEKEVRELLLAVHGEITAGPSPIGAYTVEIPAGGDPSALVLARLRSEPVVSFAEPATGAAR